VKTAHNGEKEQDSKRPASVSETVGHNDETEQRGWTERDLEV